MNRLLVLLYCLLTLNVAFAEEQVSKENLKQEDCGFPDAMKENNWKTLKGQAPEYYSVVTQKVSSIDKEISQGDNLLYVRFQETLDSYVAPSKIELISKGFMNSNLSFEKGSEFYISGLIQANSQKQQYFLIRRNIDKVYYLVMKSDGNLCSVKVSSNDGRSFTIKEADVSINGPLSKWVTKGNSEYALAVSVDNMTDVTATIVIKLFHGGKVVKQKSLQFDSMSGAFSIGDLNVKFDRINNRKIKITSIVEPDNYVRYLGRIGF